jgi:starch synthase
MPSRFEPCGLNQMYSLRYGTIPVVRAIGGLDDSVVDFDGRSRSGTGFKFTAYEAGALYHAWRRAVLAYEHGGDAWQSLVRRAMRVDLSWGASSRAYLGVYQHALADAAKAPA